MSRILEVHVSDNFIIVRWPVGRFNIVDVVAGAGSGDCESGTFEIDWDNPVKTNDIKKGQRIFMRTGWFGIMADNMKGNTRMVDVIGWYRETGSVYAHDILAVQDVNNPDLYHNVEHTDKQLALRKSLSMLGW